MPRQNPAFNCNYKTHLTKSMPVQVDSLLYLSKRAKLPAIVEPKYDGKPVPAPEGATIIFDGKSLEGFTNKEWELKVKIHAQRTSLCGTP